MNTSTSEARRSRWSQRLTVLALTGATVTAVTATAVTVATADRTPPAPVWAFEEATEEREEREERPDGLTALLMPYEIADHWYAPGPDVVPIGPPGEGLTEVGNLAFMKWGTDAGDAAWSGVALPHLVDATIEYDVRTVAARAYTDLGGHHTVTVFLIHPGEGTARAMARSLDRGISGEPGVTRGPSPRGHDGVRCHRTPRERLDSRTEAPERADAVECVAHGGGVVMLAQVHAARAVNQDDLEFVGDQIDRLTRQGQPT
ncbi:hypothetical protein JNUCC64_15330 [Streptomyces sp. JNUCC 64]